MALTSQQARKAPNRKVRAHTKSRRGCGNCKLRKVKCDESRPNCKKCTTFGVVCDYDGIQPDLQLAVTGRGTMEIQQEFSSSPIPIVRMMLDTSLGRRSDSNPAMKTLYELKAQDLKLLSRFRGRTALTVSADKVLYFYQNEMMSLAWSHPYLMHAVLTLTLMHDRHLSAIPNKSMSTAEAFHWYQATALFNSRVSTRVLSSERAALWTTAAMLGAMTFSDIEAMTPEEAWPLRSPSFADLDWLRMSTGKNEFKVSQASDTAEDQARDAQRTVSIQRNTLARQELDGLPQNFAQVFGLYAASTEDNNPYHAAATGFAQIVNAQDTKTVILSFLYFVSEMRPDFKILLQLKDSRALLILAYWYAKVYRTVWWIERRASLEGRAICIYLERYFQHEKNIQLLLQFPKSILFTSAV